MFSKEYFRYLFNSKKYLIVLVLLMSLFNIVATTELKGLTLLLQGLYALVLAYTLPLIVFRHVHDRKAVDTYFSLPVSRKALLGTGILFCFLTVYLTLAPGIISYVVLNHALGWVLLTLIEAIPAVLAVIVFNTAIYLLGNSIVDGVIMLGAYTFLPLAVKVVCEGFLHFYVAGTGSGISSRSAWTAYLSPVWMAMDVIGTATDKKIAWASLIVLILVSIVFGYVLYRSYVNRAAERAESRSTGLFSYPFVITAYMIISLFAIATFDGFRINTANLVLYILLFAVFMTANFIYQRKIFFSWKLPLIYVLALIVSIVFAGLCFFTEGFGMARNYEKAEGSDRVCIGISYYYEKDGEIMSYVREQTGEELSYIYVNTNEYYKGVSMSARTSDMIDGYRQKAIDNFYRSEPEYRGFMYFFESNDIIYDYDLAEELSFEDLKKLAEDSAVTVTIETQENEYILMPDGMLKRR